MDLATAVPGIDLSHHDDAKGAQPIDFDRMVSAVRWAIVRVGDGGATDRSFTRYVDGLAGRIPLGTYLFCRPGRDPVAQALAWAGAVHAAGVPFALGHWADLEASDGRNRADVARWIAQFLAAADDVLGQPVSLYTSATWWGGNVDPDLTVGERLWWVARYPFGDDVPDDPAAWPAHVADRARPAQLPHAPFDAPVAIWQWTSQGRGAGVGTYRAGALDCDLMAAPVFAALTGVHDAGAADQVTPPAVITPTPEPAPQEDEMPEYIMTPPPNSGKAAYFARYADGRAVHIGGGEDAALADVPHHPCADVGEYDRLLEQSGTSFRD